ncbi:MAG: hypothetical protein B7Z03_05875 [Hydrogenophilales bacterium 32-62-9]|nr:MAG: hypothetical protein B7Z03_05875 [Hydrogenophilales bacterium 32-62-9]
MLSQNLILSRCPHCSVANPNLFIIQHFETNNHEANRLRRWGAYRCSTCGGVVTAWAPQVGGEVVEVFPSPPTIQTDLPDRPRAFLQQALNSIHAPSGAVMLAASAVDAMLKLKNYVEGSLYSRIEKAATDHLITREMAQWAHEVRLDANDQRHADQAAALPDEEDAKRAIDFASALADFLFVLPSRVERGIARTSQAE